MAIRKKSEVDQNVKVMTVADLVHQATLEEAKENAKAENGIRLIHVGNDVDRENEE